MTKLQLPIETRTAANDWVVIDGGTNPVVAKLALPEKWLKGGISKYDVLMQGVSRHTADQEADWIIGPGEHKRALNDIDYLHGMVNQVYTLYDDGYIGSREAASVFR
jgi:hypothetical protein